MRSMASEVIEVPSLVSSMRPRGESTRAMWIDGGGGESMVVWFCML